jgi:hypothetical protein
MVSSHVWSLLLLLLLLLRLLRLPRRLVGVRLSGQAHGSTFGTGIFTIVVVTV